MVTLSSIEGVLRHVSPNAVARFIERQGYERMGGEPGHIDVYAKGGTDVVLLPLNQEASDYPRALRSLIEVFITSTKPLDDIVGSIVLPHSDIFRYRIETPESVWGHLRLNYTHGAMHALFDLLQYTAAGVSSHKTDYRRVSESAKAFADQCRFGQTEYGSFVLKVYCPTSPLGVIGELDEPFGRVTTQAVVENLEFLASDKSEDPGEPLPPTLNRNVASAVERLRPQGNLGITTEVQMRYSSLPYKPDAAFQNKNLAMQELATLDLGQFIFSRAQSVRDRLKKAEQFRRELVRGYITELHKDRPMSAAEQSHEITLEVKYGANWRQLRLRLLPQQYRNAVRWHDQNLEIDVDAVVNTGPRVWTVTELHKFEPSDLSKDGPNLFTTSPTKPSE